MFSSFMPAMITFSKSRQRVSSIKKSDKIVMVSSDANPSIEERRGAFKIVTSNNASVEITVSQKGSKPKLEVDSIVNIAWNAEDYILHVNSNDPKWSAEVKSGCAWCKIVKRKDQQLELSFKENDTDNSRTAVVRITTQNMPPKDVTITQGVYGYMALYEDYFRNIGGTKRITKLSGSAYVIGSYGLRFSSYMIRWKVAEIDLLNVNMSFSKSFLLSWEPMIRGYLPLQRDGRRWTAYCGFGRCFPIVDTPLNGAVAASHSKVLLVWPTMRY